MAKPTTPPPARDPRDPALDPADPRDPARVEPAGTHAGPSGSSHAAVEQPRDKSSMKWLWIAIAAVIVLLLLFFLLPGDVETVEGDAVVAPVTDEAVVVDTDETDAEAVVVPEEAVDGDAIEVEGASDDAVVDTVPITPVEE